MGNDNRNGSTSLANAAHVAGDQDLQFGGSGYVRYVRDPFITDPTTDTDQRIYVITYGTSASNPSVIAGRLPTGAVDPAFGNLALPFVDDSLRAVMDVQGLIFNNNGKITCVGVTEVNTGSGRYLQPAAIRITTLGTSAAIDEGFGNEGRMIYEVDLSKEAASRGVDLSHVDNSRPPHTQAATHGFVTIRRTVQVSGDILFCCSLFNYNTQVESYHLLKIDENGAPVTTFGTNGVLTLPAASPERGLQWVDYGIDGNGSITLAGRAQGPNAMEGVLARYTSAGKLDSGFGNSGEQIIKIEGANVYAKKVTVLDGGEVIILLSVKDLQSQGSVEFGVMKLDKNGKEDASFNGGRALLLSEMGGISDALVYMELDKQERIIVAGQDAVSKQYARMTRIMPDGTLDSEFGINGSRTYDNLSGFRRLGIQKGTDILAVAQDQKTLPSEVLLFRFFGEAGSENPPASRASGELDPYFFFSGPVPLAVFIDPNPDAGQRFYVVGEGDLPRKNSDQGEQTVERKSWISRYNAEGSLDTSFNGGRLELPSLLVGIAESAYIVIDGMIFDSDGSITCVGDAIAISNDPGYYTSSAALRLTSTGELDKNFGSTGNGTAIFENRQPFEFSDPSNELNLRFATFRRSERKGAGGSFFLSSIPSNADRPEYYSANYLVKITSDGLPDTGFHGRGFLKLDSKTIGNNWTDYGVDDQGRLIAIGETTSDGTVQGVVVRFTPNGTLDSTFGSGGRVIITGQGGRHRLLQLDVSADGKSTVLLTFPEQGDDKIALMRLADNGAADGTFNNGNPLVIDYTAAFKTMQVDGEGRYLVAKSDNGNTQPRLYRVTPNGSIDTGFGSNGSVEYPELTVLRLYAVQNGTDLLAAAFKLNTARESFARILGS
ncbi:hypothetical protein [Pseudomonas sp. Ps21-P2]|uniref:hypothetical protein n=1 Tax=Pseudomonas sp. Ps21-P2 TaxID=3080331 RepID=UPI0032092EFE